MSQDLSAFVDLAGRLADAAGAIARRYFRTRIAVDDKADASPVTIADREAEAAMRAMIERAFPEHGVIGEEHGTRNPGASHVWVLDPIDGTKSFITGRPLFGSLVALCRDGRPILGIIDCPALDERWIGAADRPTRHGVRGAEGPVRTRACAQLADAALYCTSPLMFDADALPRFERVQRAVKLPMFGGDCYAYGLVASGFADLVVEADLNPYDWAAVVPVLSGAGGSLTDWQGQPLELTTSKSRVLAVGDRQLVPQAVALLGG